MEKVSSFKRDLYIRRPRLEAALHEAMKDHRHVYITGRAATGKTTLMSQYLLDRLHDREVIYIRGYQLSDTRSAPEEILKDVKEKRLLVLDGMDEIIHREVLTAIERVVIYAGKYNIKVVFLSRYSMRRSFEMDAVRVDLDAYPITAYELTIALRKVLGNRAPGFVEVLTKRKLLEHYTPVELTKLLGLYSDHEYSAAEMDRLLDTGLTYHNRIIEDASAENKIILPEPPQIITDVSIIHRSLLEKAGRNPRLMYDLTSRQFEELVGELFEKRGYGVKLTQNTRDGGKDLIVIENKLMDSFMVYVECKQHAPDNPVTVGLVRQLYGTVSADNVTAGIMVTSSYFTKDAYKFSETVKHRMSLIDYTNLEKQIRALTVC